jgi:hypothetical protein
MNVVYSKELEYSIRERWEQRQNLNSFSGKPLSKSELRRTNKERGCQQLAHLRSVVELDS